MNATAPLPGPFRYELDEPNVCVLDFAEWQVSPGAWEEAREILHLDGLLRERFRMPTRSGEMVQPWASQLRRPSGINRMVPLQLRFRFQVRELPHGPIEFVIEQPARWKAAVNGRAVPIGEPAAWQFDPAMRRVPIPVGALRLGENELTISTVFTESTNLEAVFLLGAFGVNCVENGVEITSLPGSLEPRDVCSQGLPFYSGRIVYRLPAPTTDATLVIGKIGGACARLADGSDQAPIIGWPPYTAPARVRRPGMDRVAPPPGHVRRPGAPGLLAAFLLVVAWRLRLEQYLLELGQPALGDSQSFSGAGYVDVHVRLPGLVVLTILAVVLAFACRRRAIRRAHGVRSTRRMLFIGVPRTLLVVGVALVGALIPALVQRFVVDPNPLLSEQPYLERSIAATRSGLGLDTIDVETVLADRRLPGSRLLAGAASGCATCRSGMPGCSRPGCASSSPRRRTTARRSRRSTSCRSTGGRG